MVIKSLASFILLTYFMPSVPSVLIRPWTVYHCKQTPLRFYCLSSCQMLLLREVDMYTRAFENNLQHVSEGFYHHYHHVLQGYLTHFFKTSQNWSGVSYIFTCVNFAYILSWFSVLSSFKSRCLLFAHNFKFLALLTITWLMFPPMMGFPHLLS